MKKILAKSKVVKVKIGNNVFVSWNSIILPNVVIGDDVIIGVDTVITKDIPNNSVVVGNLARIIGETSEYLKRHKENLQNKKVYDTYWKFKIIKEKEKMKKELEFDFRYDE